MFAVGVLAERAKVRSYLVDEHLSLRLLSNVDHLLNDVVRKLVLHHRVECAVTSMPRFKYICQNRQRMNTENNYSNLQIATTKFCP